MTKLPMTHLGEFRLDAVIQDGPYSMAIRGYQESLQRPVFIKLLKPHIQHQEQWLTRFQREAQICATLKSPHIVDVYTIGRHEDYTYLALQFVDGQSLDKALKSHTTFPLEPALDITRQITLGLHAAHEQGIIHRDLKPGNVLIDRNGHAKLADFGMAHLGEETTITQQNSIIGTPAYMAPEQITGESITPAADFFALGVTFYEMITGRRPFDGDNYSECMQRIMNETPPPPSLYISSIPLKVDEFIAGLLQKDAARRPQSASQILQQIKILAKETDIELVIPPGFFPGSEIPSTNKGTQQQNASPETPKPPIRRFVLWGMPIIMIAAIVGAALFSAKKSMNPQMEPPIRNYSFAPDSIIAQSRDSSIIDSPTETMERQNEDKNPVEPTASQSLQIESEKAIQRPDQYFSPAIQDSMTMLFIQAEPWAHIMINGAIADSMAANFSRRLSTGSHNITLTHPHFSPKVFALQLTSGTADTIFYSFYQQASWLDISVRPWAEIYIDGKYIDSTPLKRPIVVENGQHVLEFKNPYFKTYRQLVQAAIGDTLVIRKVLEK